MKRKCPKCEHEWKDSEPETRTEFIVCGARGYPDPMHVHPNTLDNAIRFRDEHGGYIQSRSVSSWRREA